MENFRIESLAINKIGAFEHIKMDFPKKTDPDKAEIHILTGENGTGKSTVLEMLASCADVKSDRRLYKKLRFSSPTLNDECSYIISVNNHGKKDYFEKLINGITPHFKRFQTFEEPEFTYAVSKAFFAYSGSRLINEETIEEGNLQLDNPFTNAVDFSKSVDSKQFTNWLMNNKIQALIAYSNQNYERQQKYEKYILRIDEIISEIIGQELKFVLQDRPNAHVAIKLEGEIMSIDVLPDGIKSIISWLGDLVRRLETMSWIGEPDEVSNIFDRNFILFLDEIEVHLHPAWQRKILPVVQKLFKNAQIFISTHSPFVVGSVDGAWVHKLKKEGAYAVLDGEPILSEDAESYDTILEEIFGIKERFGVRVEEDLKQFYQFKSKILNDEDYDIDIFLNLVSKLASESIELESMLGMELKQIKRLTGKDFLATV